VEAVNPEEADIRYEVRTNTAEPDANTPDTETLQPVTLTIGGSKPGAKAFVLTLPSIATGTGPIVRAIPAENIGYPKYIQLAASSMDGWKAQSIEIAYIIDAKEESKATFHWPDGRDSGWIDQGGCGDRRDNLARLEGAKAAQSGFYADGADNGRPENAIDGRTDGNWGSGSVSHTSREYSPGWWQVKLRKPALVRAITLYPRTDDGSTNPSNFTVSLLQEDVAGAVPREVWTKTFNIALSSPLSIPIDGERIGNMVKIVTGITFLTLAEVVVVGSEELTPCEKASEKWYADYEAGTEASIACDIKLRKNREANSTKSKTRE
jgi:hypothetical protein